MKNFYFLIFAILTTSIGFAQIPSGYYNSATGTGYTLKTQLKTIITNGHSPKSYDQLFSLDTGYRATDVDDFYEDDDSVMDMYSENPTASDPYNYSYYANPSDKCGNYNSEMDCYNGEHLMPQSVYNSNMPMVGDIHQVIPTDGYVNGGRSNYPFGETNSPTNTYMNGSKKGNNSTPGYSGIVFEPIDEFKGDIARCLLYFAVRYEDQVASWNHSMLNGTSNQVYEDWFITLLLDWHNNDAVNQREINRNNASYIHQGNRNPFIDHQEYANMIWNPTPDTEAPTDPTNLVASNPTDNSIDLSWTASTDNIGVISYDIYIDGTLASNSSNTSTTANGLTADTNYCFTIKAKDAAGNESGFSSEDCETTTNNGTIGGSDCLTETFANLDTSIGSYSDVSWTGDEGGTWTATEARTDQVINITTTAAITVRNGVLTLPTTSGGIGALTVTTKRVFSGSDGTFNVNVNGTFVGTIAYSATEQTVTLPNINIENSVSIVIDGNSGTNNRVVFDDLSYTCYSALNVEDFNIASVKIHPNPVKNTLTIDLKSDVSTSIDIFDILGKRVLKHTISKTSNLNVQNLNSGIYIVKITQGSSTVTKKLIKQ
ncbi:putative secreted protein (Por secretion system target) [Winogradskyella pacifica]|uniref:Putative secreted protein (Por secretion system target) n=1 Tax=Winogradskyella pacifica TaxID=664642 RepID=A0A3D9MXN6_9FLAO|nr:endonuclease [Winogradskyella pacifica]REE24903.1 putative secreted protein (Por secretion system target) [Winogradskyella pacifica]